MITMDSFLTAFYPTAATVFFVGIYSLLLSTIFGHPSYWRLQKKKEGTKRNRFPEYLIDPCYTSIGSYFKIQADIYYSFLKKYGYFILYQMSRFTRIHTLESKKDLFPMLIDCILLEVFSFLSAADHLSMSLVSHSLLSLTNQKEMWINLSNVYFINGKREELLSKIYFFSFMKTYPLHVVKVREGLNVIINGCVYDLTKFARQHPGGEEILDEWNGKDATNIFSLALHSSFAQNLMEEFLVWPKSSLISV